MGIISFLILGAIVGAIARALVPGRLGKGFLPALACGVIGALVGGMLSSAIFHVGLGAFWNLRTWLIAIAGSALVLLVWGAIKGRSNN
ncbi:MAG: GlsB/YeaQ/YmgE family stress response membrane protein [Propionibacteriaceae bacterium]|jgi:uncharacterized membrane protein YeaQ/YmgE (transglycosylase-associated protein family)|nr:GlsB/YeaQ/YmgE family stress response membrane protein [Propionibacteriaceae bacterium]